MPTVTYPPPWEDGPGAADPGISAAKGSYTGNGQVAALTGKVGTINAGSGMTVPLAGTPAQIRFYIGADGNLYAVGNQTTQTYLITGPVANPPPLVSIYNPTK